MAQASETLEPPPRPSRDEHGNGMAWRSLVSLPKSGAFVKRKYASSHQVAQERDPCPLWKTSSTPPGVCYNVHLGTTIAPAGKGSAAPNRLRPHNHCIGSATL